MKHLRNVARGSRSVARAPHIGGTKCVLISFHVFGTHLFLTFHGLTVSGTNGTSGTRFFKLFTKFFYLHVFFLKTNFNLNLLSTNSTTRTNPYISRASAISFLVPHLVPT